MGTFSAKANDLLSRATKEKSRLSIDNFFALKKFLDDVRAAVTMGEVPPELIMNWDKTGIKLVPPSSWTMEQRGSQRVEMVGVNDKQQIAVIFCGTILDLCNSSTREKHPAATRSSSFLPDGTSPTLPNTGLLRRP